jgi:hypothetical protein
MRRTKLMAGLTLGIVVAITLVSFTAYRLVKRAFGNETSGNEASPTQMAQGTPPTGMPSNQEVSSTPDAPVSVVVTGEVMAQAFRSGKLPAPLPQPEGIPELAAMQLAKRVLAEDDQSTAALLTAIQMSGFSVRADDGSLAYESVKPGQGIMIDAWEVAALAKVFGDGMQVKLSDLSDAFASSMPSLKDAPVDKLFLAGLRGASQKDQPAMRFWADFIAELGRQSREPYDLLSPNVDTSKVDLDAIQVSLMLRRLAADLMIQEGNKDQKGQWLDREREWSSPRWQPASYEFDGAGPFIRDAVWHPELGPRLVLVEEGGAASRPCTLSELASQVMDVSAYTTGKLFDAFLEYVAEHGVHGAEKYGKATSRANAVLALIKLIAYYACLETNITMSGNPPLVRTQSIYQPGERRTLTGTVRENTKNWQAVNCTRIALNGVNLDFSLPNDGPVAGVTAKWLLAEGGTTVTGHGYTFGFVEFVSTDGTPRIQSAMVPISNPAMPKTNEEGEIKFDIEGVKQREELIKPVAVMKEAKVQFSVAPKASSMSQDLIDAVGNGVRIPGKENTSPIAGPLSFIVGGMVETLLRANLHLSKTLTIPVKDWVSCDGGWGGTIRYSTINHIDQNVGGTDNIQTNTIDEYMDDALTLRGDPKVGSGWNGTPHGSFDASYSLRVFGVTVFPPHKLFHGAVVTTEDTTKAGGAGDARVELNSLGDNKYDIHVMGGTIEGTHHWHTACAGECKGKPQPDMDNPMQYSALGISATAKEDPNNPGVLHGSETREDTPSPGATTTISWNLSQCQGGK